MNGVDGDPFQQAAAAHAEGRLEEAAAGYEACLKSDPRDAVAMALLGAVRTLQGRAEEGQALLERSVGLDPGNEVAWLQLGVARLRLADFEGSVEAIEQARRARMPFPETVAPLATSLARLRRFESIQELAAELDAEDIGWREAQLAAAEASLALGRLEEAEHRLRTLLSRNPDDADALARLIARCLAEPTPDGILKRLRSLQAERPDSIRVLATLGEQYGRFGLLDEARRCWQEVVALDPTSPIGHYEQARVLAVLGNMDECLRCLERVLEIRPGDSDAWLMLSQVKRFKVGDPLLNELDRIETDLPGRPARERCNIHFAIAQIRDSLGEYDRAFAHLSQGSALHRAAHPSDIDQQVALARTIADSAPPESWRSMHRPVRPDGPIFVVGMPRSGTTLTERILARHHLVHGAGELTLAADAINHVGIMRILEEVRCSIDGSTPPSIREFTQRYLAGLEGSPAEGARICDKQPQNHRFLGPLAVGLANASIVHCVRDPRDIAVSCYQAYFREQPWSFDLRDIGRCLRSHEELMRHWHRSLPGRIVTVRYERLVSEPEREIGLLLDQIGLPFDERCLTPELDDGAVNTASIAQVRRPINTSSVGRWTRYKRHLAPLLEEIDDLLPYDSSDHSSSRT